MPYTLKTNKSLRMHNSEHFLNSVTNSVDSVYTFVGKGSVWGSPDTPPTSVSDNELTIRRCHMDMMAVKKIPVTDMMPVIARYDWVSGQVYDEYRPDYSPDTPSSTGATSLEDAKFYVKNSSNNVYKCISNNIGVPSTVHPTSTSLGVFQTADGYIWKFMYAISGAVMLKFGDENWIPVATDSAVSAAAVDGAISSVVVKSGGAGYPPSTTVPVYIEVDGNLTAEARITATVTGGAITSLSNLINVGTALGHYTPNYVNMPVVLRQITSTGIAESATALITTNNYGKIGSITLKAGGSGYTTGTVYIEQSMATGVAVTDGAGTITSVTIPNLMGGANNTMGECKVVASQGSGFVGLCVVSPIGGHGYNPVKELLCSTIALTTKLIAPADSADVPPDITFRQFGVVINPTTYGTDTIFTGPAAVTVTKLNVSAVSNGGAFAKGQIVYGGTSGAKAQIVSTAVAGVLSIVYTNNYKFVPSELLYIDSTHSATINSITNPEVERQSGDIVYFENVAPVTRNASQIETIKVFFNF